MARKKNLKPIRTDYETSISEERKLSGEFKLSKKLTMSPEEHQQPGDEAVLAIVASITGDIASTTSPTLPAICPKLSEVKKIYCY